VGSSSKQGEVLEDLLLGRNNLMQLSNTQGGIEIFPL
jgi:hypothetical protein